MRCDLLSSGLIKQPALDAVALYDQYHTTLCNLLDAHAPVKSKKLSVSIPWFDPAIIINDLFCTLLFQCAQFRAPEPKSG